MDIKQFLYLCIVGLLNVKTVRLFDYKMYINDNQHEKLITLTIILLLKSPLTDIDRSLSADNLWGQWSQFSHILKLQINMDLRLSDS